MDDRRVISFFEDDRDEPGECQCPYFRGFEVAAFYLRPARRFLVGTCIPL